MLELQRAYLHSAHCGQVRWGTLLKWLLPKRSVSRERYT